MSKIIKLNRSHIAKALKKDGNIHITQLQSLGYDIQPIDWIGEILGKSFTIEQISGFTGTLPLTPINREYNKKRKRKKRKKRKVKQPKVEPKPVENKYKDNPKWDEKRRAIYKRDRHRCVQCGNGGKLNAHHLLYEPGKEIWDVPDFYLVTLCDECHKLEHSKRLAPPRKHF